MLYSYGFRNCSILNGGWTAWLAENQPVSIEYTKRKNAVFKFSSSDALAVINYQKVLEASEKGNAVILDTRSIDEFCGNVRSSECKKSGRIPGSIFMDWSYAVDYHGNKKFKTRAELMNLFSHIGVDADREILTYCRSGVRSAHTSFVLQELLGYHHVKNYDGSWIEWSSIDHLPVQQDSIERVR